MRLLVQSPAAVGMRACHLSNSGGSVATDCALEIYNKKEGGRRHTLRNVHTKLLLLNSTVFGQRTELLFCVQKTEVDLL